MAWLCGTRTKAARGGATKAAHRIAVDTPEFIAVQLACTIAGVPRPQPTGDPPAIDFVGEIPHGAHAMAMLAHEPAQWVVRKKDTREFTAWCERIKEWTGHWPEPKQLWLDETAAWSHASTPMCRPSAHNGASPIQSSACSCLTHRQASRRPRAAIHHGRKTRAPPSTGISGSIGRRECSWRTKTA
jgi:hypothetical protein